jgi:hypothetical protein
MRLVVAKINIERDRTVADSSYKDLQLSSFDPNDTFGKSVTILIAN